MVVAKQFVYFSCSSTLTIYNDIHKFCVRIIYNNEMSDRFVSSLASLINGQAGLVMLKSRQFKMIEFTAPLKYMIVL